MKNQPSFNHSLKISFLSHFVCILFLFTLFQLKNPFSKKQNQADFEVIVSPKPSENSRPVNIEKRKPETPEIKKNAVFGITKKSIQSSLPSDAETIGVKTGNTVNKENDQKKLKPEDAESLPIPTDEYLINEMPKLKGEVKIPYPEEAKKKGIEGSVLFELLIDANGKVRECTFIRGPGYGLNEAAQSAVQNFIFTPAKMGDKTVAVKIRYAYKFILQR